MEGKTLLNGSPPIAACNYKLCYNQFMEKFCSGCNTTKGLDEFGVDRRSKDGHNFRCKECCRNIYRANREPQLERSRKTREKNKLANSSRSGVEVFEKQCVDCLRRRPSAEFHKDVCTTDGRSSRCKECNINKSREWYKKNKERASATVSVYRKTLRGRSVKLASDSLRSERSKAAGPMRSDVLVVLQLAYGSLCVKCKTKVADTVDHIIPLSWEGTSNNIRNLQPLCKSCNSSKQDSNNIDYRPFILTDDVADALIRVDRCGY